MRNELRVAIVGHGLIGAQRAEAIHALRHHLPVRVAATVDPVRRDASLYGDAPHFSSISNLSAHDYDCAVVSLPHDVAAASALTILAEGKPLLIEKPLGRTLDEARSVAGAASKLSTPSFVGYNYRFLENVSKLIETTNNGDLGSVRSVELTLGHGGHPHSATGWKLDPNKAGGGVVIDPGVHMIDILLQICPEIQLSYVTGTTGFWGTGIEEDVVAIFGDGSVIATLRLSHVRWLNTMRIEVWGTDGYGIAEGRGGNYGNIRFRRGTRWAWARSSNGRSQIESEENLDFGPSNRSLDRELNEILLHWIGPPDEVAPPHPATMEQAVRVSTIVDDLYTALKLGSDA